jgi:hypothetical protein
MSIAFRTGMTPMPGLCGACRHVRPVRTRKGSTFLLCRRAESDPSFRKYPPLPVLSCPGFELRARTDPDPEWEEAAS